MIHTSKPICIENILEKNGEIRVETIEIDGNLIKIQSRSNTQRPRMKNILFQCSRHNELNMKRIRKNK